MMKNLLAVRVTAIIFVAFVPQHVVSLSVVSSFRVHAVLRPHEEFHGRHHRCSTTPASLGHRHTFPDRDDTIKGAEDNLITTGTMHDHGWIASSTPNPVVGRRHWLKHGSMAASVATVLMLTQSGSATASPTSTDSTSSALQSPWMADTSHLSWLRQQSVLEQLQHEAAAAADQVTVKVQMDYQRDGIAVVRNVVSSRWIELLRTSCDEAQDEAGPYSEYLHQPTDAGIFFTDLELSRRLAPFAAFCQYGPCAAVAGKAMGGTNQVRYLYDQLFIKEPGVSTMTPWHQDGGYWRVQGPNIGSVFVPLDPVRSSDSLAFVRGTHRWPLHNPQHFADGTPYTGTSLPPMPDVSTMIRQGQVDVVSFDLQPGDALVFDARTVHGGYGNWGRALSTRWTGDGTTFWDRPGEGAVPTGSVGLQQGDSLELNEAAFPAVWSCTDQCFC